MMDVSIHSNKKPRLLGYYFSIIRKGIIGGRKSFKKLYYADLYCGDGECYYSETNELWDSPLIASLLKHTKEGFPLCCIVNDSDKEKIEKLKIKTKDYASCIADYGTEDANTYYNKALEYIPKDQFSIFFLDPYNHEQLKWTTIKGISEHTHTNGRRPEIIINLMVWTMLGCFLQGKFDTIDESLGTHEWHNRVIEYQKKRVNRPVETAILDTFVEQLKKLGYFVPTPIPITNTTPANTVYFLIWATNKQGYNIIEKNVMPYLLKHLKDWQAENVKARRRTDLERFAKEQNIRTLNNYF